MHPIEIVFWVIFASISSWVLWGFVRFFLREDSFPGTGGVARHRASGGSHADNSAAGAGILGASSSSPALSTDPAGDSDDDTGGDTGGDSGGGDFSGGGGESGGGGSSGGW